MRPANKILKNTVILFVKIVICTVLSLATVPIVLHAMGQRDYGLFTLIAGIITLLSFINASMTLSTQRYLSVTMGTQDRSRLLEVYNLSVLLHLLIATLLVVLIEAVMPWLVDHVLNIDPGSESIAHTLIHILVVSLFFTVVSVPFDAVLNAYEDMLAFSVVSIIESLLKLAVAVLTVYTLYNKLYFYGLGLCVVALAVFVIKSVYVARRYRELHLSRAACQNRRLFFELLNFAGWNTLSAFALLGRNQGVAIVINHFWGTVANAAYGIGNQVSNVLGYFSATIQKSVNPQLMMSEGANQKERLYALSFALTKFSCLCLSVMALPLIMELPTILDLWLHGNVPIYTLDFTRCIIILSLLYQSSSGLMSAIQSSGNIKWYTITISLILAASFPALLVAIHMGVLPSYALWVLCAVEFLSFVARLLFARHLLHFPVAAYCSSVILPLVVCFSITGAFLYGMTMLVAPSIWRVVLTTAIGIVVFCTTAYWMALNPAEREHINSILSKAKTLTNNISTH